MTSSASLNLGSVLILLDQDSVHTRQSKNPADNVGGSEHGRAIDIYSLVG